MLLYITIVVLIALCQTSDEIVCQSENDYYLLLYKICIQSAPCRHLYHLYPLEVESALANNGVPETDAFIDYRNQRDFGLFRYQLSRLLIFRVSNATERRLVLQNLVPDAWLPNITVSFSRGGDACSDEEHIQPIHAIYALYAMHLYKMVVSDEFFCRDPNERFLLDPLTDTSFCIDKTGKSTHNESNFDHYLTLFMPILIFSMLIFAFALFANLFYKRYLLYGL